MTKRKQTVAEQILSLKKELKKLKKQCDHPEEYREKWRTLSTAGWDCKLCGHQEHTE